jgi:hypothetical protein
VLLGFGGDLLNASSVNNDGTLGTDTLDVVLDNASVSPISDFSNDESGGTSTSSVGKFDEVVNTFAFVIMLIIVFKFGAEVSGINASQSDGVSQEVTVTETSVSVQSLVSTADDSLTDVNVVKSESFSTDTLASISIRNLVFVAFFDTFLLSVSDESGFTLASPFKFTPDHGSNGNDVLESASAVVDILNTDTDGVSAETSNTLAGTIDLFFIDIAFGGGIGQGQKGSTEEKLELHL